MTPCGISIETLHRNFRRTIQPKDTNSRVGSAVQMTFLTMGFIELSSSGCVLDEPGKESLADKRR